MNFSFMGIPGFEFGPGSSEKVGEILQHEGFKKVLCVYDQGVKAVGIVDKIVANIEKAGIEVVHYGNVIADPPEYVVEEGAEVARKANPDAVVAIGGGSTIDTAKGINMLLHNPSPVLQYAGHGTIKKRGKFLLTIPTTFGTSSEFTFGMVISDSKNHCKVPIGDPKLMSAYILIDPALALGMPPHITAATGLDCLGHAIECYTSNVNDPVDELLAQQAIKLCGENLVKVYNDPKNIELRTNMSLATTYAGPIQCNTVVSLGHAMGHSIGSRYHMPHGFACAINLPGYVEFIAESLPEKVKNIGKLLGADVKDSDSAKVAGEKVAAHIRGMLKAVNAPTLRDFKAQESDLDSLADDIMKEFFLQFCVKMPTKADVLKILKEIY